MDQSGEEPGAMSLDPTPVETRRGAFDSELSVQSAGPTTWRLLAPLIWNGTQGDTFTVPVGFVTDFATVPRFMHWLFLPYGAYTRAAVLHDWLLQGLPDPAGRKTLVAVDAAHQPITSRDADGIFRRVMQDLGVPWPKRWLGWTAVRWAALFSRRRAYGRGFLADSPRVLGMSLLALPVVLPGAVGVLISLAFVRVVNLVTR